MSGTTLPRKATTAGILRRAGVKVKALDMTLVSNFAGGGVWAGARCAFKLFGVVASLVFVVVSREPTPPITNIPQPTPNFVIQAGPVGAHTTRETPLQRQTRLQQAKERKIRKLSPWNIYQREALAGKHLGQNEYKEEVAKLGRQWQAMSSEQRQPYRLEAEQMEGRLQELEQTGLVAANTAGSQGPENIESSLPHACQKRSFRRLDSNRTAFHGHELWHMPTQLGDGDFGYILQRAVFLDVSFCGSMV